VQRLREFHERSWEAVDDLECEAILVTKSRIAGDEEDTRDEAGEALTRVLDSENLGIEEVRGETYVGNPRGLGLPGALGEIRLLQEGMVQGNTRITVLEEQVAKLNESVTTLRESGKDYKMIRSRFVSTFKRDKLNKEDPADTKIIRGGNVAMHGGDVVVDALLFDGIGGRQDFYAFEALYGMHPTTARLISK